MVPSNNTVEIKGGVVISACNCKKKNGLQMECRKSDCMNKQKRVSCMNAHGSTANQMDISIPAAAASDNYFSPMAMQSSVIETEDNDRMANQPNTISDVIHVDYGQPAEQCMMPQSDPQSDNFSSKDTSSHAFPCSQEQCLSGTPMHPMQMNPAPMNFYYPMMSPVMPPAMHYPHHMQNHMIPQTPAMNVSTSKSNMVSDPKEANSQQPVSPQMTQMQVPMGMPMNYYYPMTMGMQNPAPSPNFYSQ